MLTGHFLFLPKIRPLFPVDPIIHYSSANTALIAVPPITGTMQPSSIFTDYVCPTATEPCQGQIVNWLGFGTTEALSE
jgi:hypothetical protein